MRQKRLIGVLLFLLLACLFLCACESGSSQSVQNEDALFAQSGDTLQAEAPAHLPIVINTATFLSQEELQRRLPADETFNQSDTQTRIRALVVPHHSLAAGLAAKGIRALVCQNPSVIVIVGPNHQNIGPRAATAKAVWDTGQNSLQTDTDIVDELIRQNLAQQDDDLFKTEHSIGALIPIIAHYLPNTKVVPIVYYYRYDQKTIVETLRQLDQVLPDDAVIIASIDFSHGLTLQKAEEKDRITTRRLKDWDEKAIAEADNTFLDSPTILAALMQYLRESGNESLDIIANTNSGKIMQDSQMICTSYFDLIFTENWE